MTIAVFAPPIGLSFPRTRSPMWKTFHQEAVSGKDTPLAMWSYPRWKYSFTFDLLRSATANLELQYVMAFYNSVAGSTKVWAYTDPDDNAVTAQAFATGDGTTTSFQLVRTMSGGGATFSEPVLATTGSPIVYKNGVSDTNVTFANGIVTFTDGAPASGVALTWTGSYNWLCRFDDDSIDFSQFMTNLWELKKINFTSLKL